MREIKFRAWDKLGEEFIVRDELILSVNAMGVVTGWVVIDEDKMEQVELQQFTGLKDKNGKEIYEGDILKRQDEHCDEVVFDGGTFCVRHDKGGMDFIAYNNYFEVIGNIYENPELLKGNPS